MVESQLQPGEAIMFIVLQRLLHIWIMIIVEATDLESYIVELTLYHYIVEINH